MTRESIAREIEAIDCEISRLKDLRADLEVEKIRAMRREEIPVLRPIETKVNLPQACSVCGVEGSRCSC